MSKHRTAIGHTIASICIGWALAWGWMAHEAQAQQPPCQSNERFIVYCVRPSETNPQITRFDEQHFVMMRRGATDRNEPLLVFMPGTNGKPPGAIEFLRTAAENGYRVISLEYNDDTSVAVYCPINGGPPCSARFRNMRIYGNSTLDPNIDNTHVEAITERLYALLRWLDRTYPEEKWSRFYDQQGMVWDQIALAGQSQGAGMAAFIGKQKLVNRVILFSSPWDFYLGPSRERILAPWLAWPMTTPPERWYAGYNQREATADLLQRAYAMLQIPPDHIRIFSQLLPDAIPGRGNPYHTQGVHNPIYKPEWVFFLTGR
jgi:hypothetical protein